LTKLYTMIFRFTDALVWLLAGELAALLLFGSLLHDSNLNACGNVYHILAYIFPVMSWLASPVSGQYRSGWYDEGILQIFSRILIGALVTSGCGIIFVFLIHQSHELSRAWLGITLLLVFLLNSLVRVLVLALESRTGRWRQGRQRHNGKLRRVAVLGCGRRASRLVQDVMSNPDAGYRIEAVLCGCADTHSHAMSGVCMMQTIEQFEAFIYRHPIREVWLLPDADDNLMWDEAIARLENTAAELCWFPVMPAYVTQKYALRAGVISFDLNSAAIDSDGVLHKKIFDYLFSMAALLALSPLLIIIALAVKLSSPGPILFRQLRHGIGGKSFACLKFRTMTVHQEDGTVTQATMNDPRMTRVGRFLRNTSLDELPQFINVLMGDMSVVGPRPHAVEHNDYYSKEIRRYMSRHKVKPGITGWAQINGCRGRTDTLEKMLRRVELDLDYIRNWSFWRDIKIVLWTAFRGWTGKNVY
jgi:putative colanic acid biosynthesis UDP-glucose lipid carrier transferase